MAWQAGKWVDEDGTVQRELHSIPTTTTTTDNSLIGRGRSVASGEGQVLASPLAGERARALAAAQANSAYGVGDFGAPPSAPTGGGGDNKAGGAAAALFSKQLTRLKGRQK
jgi:hypothetical protein